MQLSDLLRQLAHLDVILRIQIQIVYGFVVIVNYYLGINDKDQESQIYEYCEIILSDDYLVTSFNRYVSFETKHE